MSAAPPDTIPRALFSADGQKWTHDQGPGPVTKIIIGEPPKRGEDAKPVTLSAAVQRDLEKHRPTVTHLHLWQIAETDGTERTEGTKGTAASFWSLLSFPSLKTLDLRGCPDLASLPALPAGLEMLILIDLPRLHTLPPLPGGGFPALREVSLQGCRTLAEDSIHALLAAAPGLVRMDASECAALTTIPNWPPALERIELNGCSALTSLPPWPAGIRRAGLRDAAALPAVPDFPWSGETPGRGIDYLDLAGTRALRALPENISTARTLFLFGSGIELPPTLFGPDDKANVAATVRAYLAEAERGTVVDHEVKVILLGNGRCGKSSLVRRLVENTFDPAERSTHGIRLRTLTLPFTPVDGGGDANAALNIWDFAGQDLYHNTHRTFLQSKAVYVLCVTNHGDGADPASDAPDPTLEAGDDVHRKLRYWTEQIAALGHAPGMDGPPPILLVRMKADRDGEPGARPPWEGCEAGEGLEKFEISAETGKNVAKLRDALAKAVAKVLGPKSRRSLGKRPMKVKEALRPLRDKNEAAFRESERLGRRVPSPHPWMSRDEFDALVRRHCPGSDYARDPGLLLEQFHLSGFLSYDANYLPDTVILDQPWAFEAVYTVMHRGRCHPRLKERGGRFRPGDLAEWAWSADEWNPTGYTLEEQTLFLKFMESHRVAARLFEASERDDGQAVYIAPYYLPPWVQAQRIVAPLETLAGPPTARAHIVSEHLGRDVAQALLTGLVRQFSRSAEVWKWGVHFRAASLDAAVTLDWKATNALELFGGQITAVYRGTDARTLHDYVVDRLRKLPAFPRDAEIEFIPETVATPAPAPAPAPKDRHTGVEAPGGGIEYATRAEAVGIKVGISYAGSNPNAATPAEQNLGELPQALAKLLSSKPHNVSVLEYSDQFREANLPRFTEDLVKQDYLVVFLSEKYFKSPYCMWELMLLYNEPPAKVFPPGRALFLALPQVPVTGEAALMIFRRDWMAHWNAWCKAREAEADQAAGRDHNAYNENLCGMKAARWYEFASHEESRKLLLNAVFQNCFNQVVSDPAAFAPGTSGFAALVEQYAKDIVAALGDSKTIYRVAAREWQKACGIPDRLPRQDSQARAKQLYYRARWRAPDYDAATDAHRMRTESHGGHEEDVQCLLEELRRACLGDLAAGV